MSVINEMQPQAQTNISIDMRAALREGWTARSVEQSLSGSTDVKSTPSTTTPYEKKANLSENKGKPLTILYGSNSGTCEAFAQTIAADAPSHGFSASRVDILDAAKQNLPADEPVVIVTASYEGEPCDNAGHFFNWITNLQPDEKLNTAFAVFGCGHSDWKKTFHKIPKTIDSVLEKAGGKRICVMGSANAASGDMISDFQSWEDDVLWPALKETYGGEDNDRSATTAVSQAVSVEVFSKRASYLRSDVSEAKVLAAKTLTAPGVPEKRHIEIQLPSDKVYRSGDYCAVLPLNPPDTVRRVMARFSIPWDAMLKISSRTTTLPTDHPISAQDLLSAYLELSQPATRRNVAMLLEASQDESITKELQRLAGDDFQTDITDKRISLLDLLERFPSIHLPLGAFISSLISMRVRQYSISSSPLSDPTKLTLTYAVLDAPSFSGQGRHVGVASHYLSTVHPGDIVHIAIKPSHIAFHLPTDAEKTPVIMIAAGAGLAPFRGFIQERAAQIGSGRRLAPAHFYFGCRHPARDDLYREEIDFWERMGAIVVHRAFSQAPEQSHGHKHIDEVIMEDKDMLSGLWEEGARVYVCGSRGLGESARQACMAIAKQVAVRKGHSDVTDEALNKWFEKVRNERFSTDVFA